MSDFFSFRRMITPRLIQFLFVVGIVLSVIGGLIAIVAGLVGGTGDDGIAAALGGVLAGLVLIVFGPLVIRVYCEFLIVFFRINETLTDVDQKMDRTQALIDQRAREIAQASRTNY